MEFVYRLPLAIQKNKRTISQRWQQQSQNKQDDSDGIVAQWQWHSGSFCRTVKLCWLYFKIIQKQQSTARDSKQTQLQQRSGASGDCGHSSKVKSFINNN